MWIMNLSPNELLTQRLYVQWLLSGSRIRFVGNPWSEKRWPQHSCHRREQEGVCEAGVPDENDRSDNKTDRVILGRILRYHTQAADFNLWRTRVGVVDFWTTQHRLGWLESQHGVSQIHRELITGICGQFCFLLMVHFLWYDFLTRAARLESIIVVKIFSVLPARAKKKILRPNEVNFARTTSMQLWIMMHTFAC